ncbi:Transcriptional regulator [Candidatus Filomicrobium marinum]|uniref:Transcriptional regulator n=2 Tax=Filomicrobium TaxID=119044 RepID=A0A0D6JFJ2_9HYPH|nr:MULTISPECIES: PAS domain S-box protein [Filomicrobium]MCV0370145.1 PAS sensor domain-containing protein [Filomicrobium sp.]CFX25585.1 Transcriptional regulator [Candidatus Filomicrobium marinum]CPR19320.1 Transcriptional regulator [Candidatus Filomicrobium marinum]SDO08928.1 PAS domain S-box-containing protein [Filomicrobium insigne]
MTDQSLDSFDLDHFSRALVENIPDAVLYAGKDGRIVYWNAGAERIFGFTASEALGQSLDIIIPENLRQRHWDGYEKTVATGHTRYGSGDLLSVPALRKDGSRISVEFSMLPYFDDQGRMIGIAAILRDATKQFETVKALRRELAARSKT